MSTIAKLFGSIVSSSKAKKPSAADIKRELREYAGAKSINQYKKNDPEYRYWSADDLYHYWATLKKSDELNAIRQKNAESTQLKNARRTAHSMIPPPQKVSYTITVNTRTRFARKDDNGSVVSWSPWLPQTTEYFVHDLLENANDHIDPYVWEHDYAVTEIESTTVTLADTPIAKSIAKMFLKSATIIRQDWLKYARGIAEYAYDADIPEGRCVYNQLTKFWANNLAGRKMSQMLDKKPINKTSPESIFTLVQHLIKTSPQLNSNPIYANIDMDDGLTPELIAAICKYKSVSCYIFNEDNHAFISNVSVDSKYTPIILYAINSHAYLISEPSVIKSIVQKRTDSAKSRPAEVTDAEELPIKMLSVVDVDMKNALTMESAKYLITCCHTLKHVVLEFYTYHKNALKTMCSGTNIVQIEFKNNDNKSVIFCVDQTPPTGNLEHDDIVKCMATKSIPYTNQGIGYCVNKLLTYERERTPIPAATIALLLKNCDNKCRCGATTDDGYEIDHIKPRCTGGKDTIDNLRILCQPCHNSKTIEEKTTDSYQQKVHDSVFNKPVVDHIMNSSYVKTFARVDIVTKSPPVLVMRDVKVPVTRKTPFGVEYKSTETRQQLVKQLPFKADMAKCRRNIVSYNKFEWPVFGVFDKPEKFDGKVKCGWYFVRPIKKHMIHRGDGVYGQRLVEYMLDNKICYPKNIIWQLIPSNKLAPNHFAADVDRLLKATEECKGLQKILPNSMVGLWGRTKRVSTNKKFTHDENQASTWVCREHTENNGVFIQSHTLENGTKLHEGTFIKEIENEYWSYPLYKHVLESELCELAEMERLITEQGAVVLSRSTDAIRYAFDNEINLFENYFWDDANTVQKYRPEIDKTQEREAMVHYDRRAPPEYDSIDVVYKSVTDDYDNLQESVKQLLDNGEGCHIDGRAGCGKSYYLKAVMAELDNLKLKYVALAPTNVAANLIGGQTVAKFCYKHMQNRKQLVNELANKSYIFIDEISMVQSEDYKTFVMIKRCMPWIRFIISGDFNQLLAVCDDYKGDMYNSGPLNTLCDGNRLLLTKCRRADNRLFEMCKKASKVRVADFPPIEKTMRNIAYRHETRMKINDDCMKRFIIDRTDTVLIPKEAKDPHSQDMHLCPGMPVIAMCAQKKLGIFKTSQYVVVAIDTEHVTLSDGNETIKFPFATFAKYFYMAFCVTVYASQGCTIAEKYTVHDWNFIYMCARAKYVALSRATDISLIQLSN